MGLNSRASVGPDTQSLGVASMPNQIRRTNQKQKQTKQTQNQTKTKNKQTRRTKTRQNGKVAYRPGWHSCVDDVLCIIRWIGMARWTKAKETGKNKPSPYKDLWVKQQNSERKPGPPPARSPEITQSRPHGHNKLTGLAAFLRLAVTQPRSQRKGETESETGLKVRINNRVPNSQSPLRVHPVVLFQASASFLVDLLVLLQLVIVSWNGLEFIVLLRRSARAFLWRVPFVLHWLHSLLRQCSCANHEATGVVGTLHFLSLWFAGKTSETFFSCRLAF